MEDHRLMFLLSVSLPHDLLFSYSILLLRNSSGRRKQEKETRRVPDKEDAFTAATKEETKRAAVKRLRPLTSSSLISTKEKEVKVFNLYTSTRLEALKCAGGKVSFYHSRLFYHLLVPFLEP